MIRETLVRSIPVGTSPMLRWVSSRLRNALCDTGSRSISSAVSLTRSVVASGTVCRPARNTKKSGSCGSRSHWRRDPGTDANAVGSG
ncbi:Uncharacterised protein [Mycobacterium tuberculosis]|uniref:Uncharacterized protein n=1 Tax=Mycobacterium tuberculosis TaxID=1773 RepID=A0A0T9E905_MYCTX|nr:Uncharacterised protein [Mycobacterium tuberculosis]CFE54096.1 Uncharacterised protein [Mycobacterium tuberculosis]CFR89017.1 Uncharacterised protein [Mycobacterium tuberculosis]CKQ85843.1 Uncharacterised protein [Mycobacterium tuberculosis]CKS62708.1 Uncharacterised protein [Mycobacterium tuberculosis]